MNEVKKRFVDQLLAADPPSSEARRRYEKEVHAMLEKTLTPRQRGIYLLGAVLLLLPAGYFALLAVLTTNEATLIKFVGAYAVATALALAGVALLLFWGYWKGVVAYRTSRRWAAGVGIVYVGLLGWLFLLMAQLMPDFQNDVRVLGFLLVVYAAVAWVRHRVAQSEMAMAEKLLEIELHLAEMRELFETQGRTREASPAPPNAPGATATEAPPPA